MKLTRLTILFLLLFITSVTNAQEVISDNKNFTLNGFSNASAFGLSKSFDIYNAYGEFALQSSYSGKNSGFYADLRVRKGIFYGEQKTIVDLREAYTGYSSEHFTIYAGNQIVNYGRATGFNPTDNVCPKDYFFLSSDFEDMQMSNFMIKTGIKPVSQINIELIAIPFFKPSVYRYDLFDMGSDVVFSDYTLPEVKFENMSYSAHLDATLPAIDFSVSAFHGYDPYYGFDVKNISLVPEISIINQAAFYKKNSIGADFSIPVKSWIISGEAAYNQTTGYKDNIFTPNPDLNYILGVEKDIYGIKIIAEYTGRYVFDFERLQPPSLPSDFTDTLQLINYMNETVLYESGKYNQRIFNQYFKVNHAVMLTLHKDFHYETIGCDLSVYYNFTTEERLIRGGILWKISDELSASCGGQLMDGPDDSIYYQAGKIMSGIWLGIKYRF